MAAVKRQQWSRKIRNMMILIPEVVSVVAAAEAVAVAVVTL